MLVLKRYEFRPTNAGTLGSQSRPSPGSIAVLFSAQFGQKKSVLYLMEFLAVVTAGNGS
jgi:hypothetical protein